MSEASDVTVRDNPDESRFEAYVDDQRTGFSAYELSDGVITFTHTEVDDAFEGHGVGSALVRHELDEVRARGGLRVRPLCPFVRAWIDQHPDYADLTRPPHARA
jgi:predicted GNAT family acetyltransferase